LKRVDLVYGRKTEKRVWFKGSLLDRPPTEEYMTKIDGSPNHGGPGRHTIIPTIVQFQFLSEFSHEAVAPNATNLSYENLSTLGFELRAPTSNRPIRTLNTAATSLLV
jgi:hypothetical protein